MGTDEPDLPTDVRGVERADDRRVISDRKLHVLKSGCRWCDCRRSMDLGQRSGELCAGAQRTFGKTCSGSLLETDDPAETQIIDSTHVKAHRSAAGGKGEQNRLLAARAEGVTRRYTHSQMLKGAFIAILLTGGEAHDCPIAERLIRRVKPAKRMLGDKAYDSAELREELDERGTKPVIEIAATGNNPSASASVSTGCAGT